MSNLIQIKRSSSTSTPASLANGEIAYSFADSSNSLFVGDQRNIVPGTPLRIAGGKYSFLHQTNLISGSGGQLTANAVVITNANSFLNQFKTNTLVVGPDGTTNASATFVVDGTANVSGNVTLGGAVTTISGNLVLSGVMSNTVGNGAFLWTSNNIQLSSNSSVIGLGIAANDTYTTTFTQSDELRVNSTYINTTHQEARLYGNTVLAVSGPVANAVVVSGNVSTTNVQLTATQINITGNNFVDGNTNFDSGTLFVDAVNNYVGINNTTPDAALTITGAANVSGAVRLATVLTVVGSATLSNTISVTGNATFSNTVAVTGNTTLSNTLVVTGATTLSNTLSVVGTANLQANVTMGGTLQTIAGNVNFDAGTLFVDSVNNRVGVSNTAPDSTFKVTGTANVSGNTVIGGTLLTQGAATVNNTLLVVGAATFSNTANVTGAATFNNTVTVTGNVAVDTNVLLVDVVNNRVGVNKTAPAVALDVVGDAVVSANLTANNVLINNDMTVNGNLTVNGVLTTIDTVNLVVEDPMFKVAKNNNVANNAGDAVDIGFYGVYANTTADMFTGLFRDASDGKYRLFKDLTAEPTATVDITAVSYKTATLISYLESGALSTNTTALAITANGSYSVALAANTLSLSTALPVTSGGTGQQSFTSAGVIYGNGTSGLQVTAAGANGDVLQVVNNLPAFGTLDGGTF